MSGYPPETILLLVNKIAKNSNCNYVGHIIPGGTVEDFSPITNKSLTFGPSTARIDIPVTVVDNNFYELTESFVATLSFPGDPVSRVSLSPESAQITIFDEDG